MWQKVSGDIIRQGQKFWSTEQFNPTPHQIGQIIDMSGGVETWVCRAYKNILIFRDNEFSETGPFFYPEKNLPNFISDKDAQYLYWIISLGEFSVAELSRLMYPDLYLKGKVWRDTENEHIWAPTKEEVPSESVEEYDYEKLAKIRTGNFIYNKAKTEGWIKSKGYGKWEYAL